MKTEERMFDRLRIVVFLAFGTLFMWFIPALGGVELDGVLVLNLLLWVTTAINVARYQAYKAGLKDGRWRERTE